MKKLIILFFLLVPILGQSQKTYFTKSAQINFYSQTVVEDVEAKNRQVVCNFNNKTGQLNFAVLIRSFQFDNSLMQEHFNGNEYMNSAKFPKAKFIGTITNLSSISFSKNGTYNIMATGLLTIHGITKKVTQSGTMSISKGKIKFKSEFKLHPVDYKISVPDGIAEEILVRVSANF